MSSRDDLAHAADGAHLWHEVLEPSSGGDAPVVVLLPGLGADHTVWDAVLPSLAGFRIVRLQHRGIGESSPAPEGWTTRDTAGDVVAVLDHLGLEQVAVYGHSLGGRIAQWVAADHPDRVTRLVLGASTVGDAHGVPRPAAATAAFASGDLRAALELSYTPAHLAAHPEIADRTAPANHDDAAFARQMAMSSAHDGADALPRITAPTLVVHGTDDGVTDARNAEILRAGIADSSLLLLSGLRHQYFEESPAANAMIAAFLRG